MITIKMMSGDEFIVTEEEANSLSGKSGLVPVQSLGGLINISSISYILPTKEKLLTRKQNKDGQWCIDQFKNNDWRLERDPSIKVLLSVYPEIRNDYDGTGNVKKIEQPSSFAKELAYKFNK